MDRFHEVIDKLTHNGEYATDVCLYLYLNEYYTSLYYLEYLNITGKELETLAQKCLQDSSFDYLAPTIRFLRSGFLSEDEIHDNLKSSNPVNFIDSSTPSYNDWEITYENYAGNFRENVSKNKGR